MLHSLMLLYTVIDAINNNGLDIYVSEQHILPCFIQQRTDENIMCSLSDWFSLNLGVMNIFTDKLIKLHHSFTENTSTVPNFNPLSAKEQKS